MGGEGFGFIYLFVVAVVFTCSSCDFVMRLAGLEVLVRMFVCENLCLFMLVCLPRAYLKFFCVYE